MTRGPAKCGTASGYAAHRRKNEDACDLCLEALRNTQPERAAVRREAVAILIKRHSVEFERLRAEVIARRAADRAWAAVFQEASDA